MYNRIGKKNRMLVASSRVATWVSVAKVILGFSVQYIYIYSKGQARKKKWFVANIYIYIYR